MTETGKTLAEKLCDVPRLSGLGEQDVVRGVPARVSATNNHISVLKGNFAPESCVLKLSGKTFGGWRMSRHGDSVRERARCDGGHHIWCSGRRRCGGSA